MSNLDEVKVGDKLIISNGAIETVTRMTKTLIITESSNYAGKPYESRYKKSTGYPPGERCYGDKYARPPNNENEIAEIMESRRVAGLVTQLNDYDFKRMPVNVMETIIRIVKANEAN